MMRRRPHGLSVGRGWCCRRKRCASSWWWRHERCPRTGSTCRLPTRSTTCGSAAAVRLLPEEKPVLPMLLSLVGTSRVRHADSRRLPRCNRTGSPGDDDRDAQRRRLLGFSFPGECRLACGTLRAGFKEVSATVSSRRERDRSVSQPTVTKRKSAFLRTTLRPHSSHVSDLRANRPLVVNQKTRFCTGA